MLRTLYRYFPRFMTKYFVVVGSKEGSPGTFLGVQVPGEEDLDPEALAVRMEYFNLFGKPVGIKYYFRHPSNL